MAKKKELKIIEALKLFFEGTKLYFLNIDKFLGYMSFPVMGQLIGMILIFTTIHLFAQNFEKIITANPIFDNIAVTLIVLLLLIIPSFALFLASFWKYMVAMGALNSMANNLISNAKLDDLKMHNDVVTRNTSTFIGILLLLSLISLIGICPLLWIILLIFMIYLCLTFQIFALEENLNCIEVLQKSVQMVKGNFVKVTLLLAFLWAFTYWLLPDIINFALEQISVFKFLAVPVEAFCQNLPIEDTQATIQSFLTSVNPEANFTIDINELSISLVKNFISAIIIGYTLPLRSICCTLLYKDLETKKLKEKKIKEL